MNETIQDQAPEQSQASVEPVNQDNSFSIPEEYQDRGWSKKINSTDDLFKAYDNVQHLIGKRPAGIPLNDASDDEWDQFYKAMGRPDDPSYDFADPEGLPDDFDTSSYKEQASQILHKAGLTPKQAQTVYQEYLNIEMQAAEKIMSEKQEQQAELDNQYDNLIKEHFGDEGEKYENLLKEDFSKHVPQSLKESFGKLVDQPDVLISLMSYVKGKQSEIDRVKAEYGAEGKLTSGGQSVGSSIDDIRKELASLRMSPESRDFTNPKYKESQQRINELQDSVRKYYNK